VSVDLSILELVAGASLVVKAVMLILLLASLASWTIIVIKWREIGRARQRTDEFEEKFWSGGDLEALYKSVKTRGETQGLESIFIAGFREYLRQLKSRSAFIGQIDMISRSMRVAMSREVDNLESSLAFLATVGSTSPYIGLFGTVWGIMNSFTSIAASQNTSLAVVAPGISEALVATAAGLAAAIPAVIAYNYFNSKIDSLTAEMDNFHAELLNIVRRHFVSDSEDAAP